MAVVEVDEEIEISKNASRKASILEYEQSLMLGKYREELLQFARNLADTHVDGEGKRRTLYGKYNKSSPWQKWFATTFRYGGNCLFLVILGTSISALGFIVDVVTHLLYDVRYWLMFGGITENPIILYLLWNLYMISLVTTSALICRKMSPQAAGSGIGEMKVILRGVVLKEYLSFRTLVAKVLGLPLVLGAALGLGREGPFVHIGAIIANQCMKFIPTWSRFEFEARSLEVIAVGCASGVSGTFGAPIGGVLYSIEIVSSYFAFRSYWHGFIASTLGAMLWHLFSIWFNINDYISQLFTTHFRTVYSYESLELLTFAFLGLMCGIGSHIFIQIQRNLVLFNRRITQNVKFLIRYQLTYTIIITAIIAFIKFPFLCGQFIASMLSIEQVLNQLFSNMTWSTADRNDPEFAQIMKTWETPYTSFYTNTFLYFLLNFIILALANTVPVPGGATIQLFRIGAGLGRCYGEWTAYNFPKGINPFGDRSLYPIIPGAYAVAGAAAFCGGVSGSVSTAVIAFEVTGQLTHFLPIIVCVLVSNIVVNYFGQSFYDSLIELKNLPYLSPISSSNPLAHQILVQDFMTKELVYVWQGCTYKHIDNVLKANKHLRFIPVVLSPSSKFLIGTMHVIELQDLITNYLNENDDNINGTEKNGKNKIKLEELFSHNGVNGEQIKVKHDILEEVADLSKSHIDSAPFQLVEGTTLIKAHNLFSMLGLHFAYVTSLGRLIGVVAIKDIREAMKKLDQTPTENLYT